MKPKIMQNNLLTLQLNIHLYSFIQFKLSIIYINNTFGNVKYNNKTIIKSNKWVSLNIWPYIVANFSE